MKVSHNYKIKGIKKSQDYFIPRKLKHERFKNVLY